MRNATTSRLRAGLAALLGLALLAPLAVSSPATAAGTGMPTDPVPDPHQAGVLWFAPTGHTLRGDFRAFWEKYGGLAQFGYPITEEFAESNGPTDQVALVVQYFERARFEHHPEQSDPNYRVELGILGTAFHQPDPPVPAQANPTAQYFDATGHNVNGPFLAYWKAHGGLFVNGNPISEAFQEVNPIDGKTYSVQYFQRERFELHPENAGTPYEVQLGLLGTQLAWQKGYFAFPRFGHAPDNSWFAGQVAITRIQGGCVYINYSADPSAGASLQPIGAGWDAARQAGLEKQGAYVVVFGHLAGPGEPAPVCPGGKPYVVTHAQINP